MASGGRHGFAQSFFQVGGNLGSSFGPLLAAFLVVPRGQASVAWWAPRALVRAVGADRDCCVVAARPMVPARARRARAAGVRAGVDSCRASGLHAVGAT